MKQTLNILGTFFLIISFCFYFIGLYNFFLKDGAFFNHSYYVSFFFSIISTVIFYKTGVIDKLREKFNKLFNA